MVEGERKWPKNVKLIGICFKESSWFQVCSLLHKSEFLFYFSELVVLHQAASLLKSCRESVYMTDWPQDVAYCCKSFPGR